MNRSSII